jgi:cob(I)alamin adenosyltransferase
MKIYTKTGDTGQTSLYRGGRVAKDAPRLEAYGTLDELNSTLGLALALLGPGPETWRGSVALQVRRIQKDLFGLGAQLATLGSEKPAWHVKDDDITALELAIDHMEETLLPLTTFILPGGHAAGASFHVARTIARRAERCVVGVQREDVLDEVIVRFLNRLSDYLFVLARYVNHQLETPEHGLVMDAV